MKEEPIKNLIEKYKSGISSLEEEETLFKSEVIVDESVEKLSTFINKNRKKAPENFNEKLWNSFEEKIKRPNKLRFGLLSAAASIALILSVFIYNKNQNTLSETEKEALLIEAKNMFLDTNQEQEAYTKILENELVTVYTKTEK